jgi:hypothetical protein
VKVNDAAAAQGDTAVGVDALAQALPKGTVLWFAAGKFARLTADAAKGAVSLTVEALVAGISDDATAIVGGSGVKRIKAGTIMVEQANGKMVPRIARLNSETSIGFLTADAEEGAYNDALSGHGVLIGGVFYKELLPENANGSFATWVGEINTAKGEAFMELRYPGGEVFLHQISLMEGDKTTLEVECGIEEDQLMHASVPILAS